MPLVLLYQPRQKGFSLVELLISVVISLIVLAGVVQLVFNSKKSSITNQEVSEIQDNARFVMDIISREIRLAGYKGCATNGATFSSIVSKDASKVHPLIGLSAASGFAPLTVYTNAAPHADITNAKANTDSIMLWYGGISSDILLKEHNPATNKFIVFDSSGFNADFKADTPVMVVDAKCESVGVFVATPNTSDKSLAYTSDKNCSGSLKSGLNCGSAPPAGGGGGPFLTGSRILPFVAAGYYVGTSVANASKYALKRISIKIASGTITYTTDEIAPNVINLKIQYVLDNGTNTTVNAASPDWTKIKAVKVTLTFASDANNPLEKTISSTIQIRNRI